MVNKKKAMGVDPLSWIKQTKDAEGVEGDLPVIKKEKPKLPKYETYEVKLTLRLGDEHLNFLTDLERQIMKSRSPKNKRERITKN